jgi:hypothetical protein
MAPSVDVQSAPEQPIKSANGGRAPAVDRVKANEIADDKIADRLGAKDMYIDAEKDTGMTIARRHSQQTLLTGQRRLVSMDRLNLRQAIPLREPHRHICHPSED